jgi:hypothetical protein
VSATRDEIVVHLGNGVFLVIARVGLWYPLDLLFFARLPLRRETRALKVMSHISIGVRARDVDVVR